MNIIQRYLAVAGLFVATSALAGAQTVSGLASESPAGTNPTTQTSVVTAESTPTQTSKTGAATQSAATTASSMPSSASMTTAAPAQPSHTASVQGTTASATAAPQTVMTQRQAQKTSPQTQPPSQVQSVEQPK